MAVMTRQEEKAMFAKFAVKGSSLRKQQMEELLELQSKFPKETFLKEDRRVSDLREKIRGQPLNLSVIINNAKRDPNSFQSKDTGWIFTPKAYHVSDIPNGIVWEEFPLRKEKAKFLRDLGGSEEIIKNVEKENVEIYVVNNTEVDPELLKDIAKFAKKKGLLEKGTLEELQSKGIFDAVEGGNFINSRENIRPISIKLGNNTFLLAPRVSGFTTE